MHPGGPLSEVWGMAMIEWAVVVVTAIAFVFLAWLFLVVFILAFGS